METRYLTITPGNLRNSHIYVRGHYDFFPVDCFGSSRRENGRGEPIKIELIGLNRAIETDIGTNPTTGKPREMFRERKWVREFFQHHATRPGDVLTLERLATRVYRLHPTTSPTIGETSVVKNRFSSMELFVGAGGLALGTEAAGFSHLALVEWDQNACQTIRFNQAAGSDALSRAMLFEGDAREFDYYELPTTPDFVFGGPPCQPFSLGGKHLGDRDARNMFPEAVRAVREVRPLGFIFENVKGLLREGFATYYEYIILQLQLPEIVCKKDEPWEQHLRRLQKAVKATQVGGLRYRVQYKMLDAANFGVPQRRHRVFIVGLRSDISGEFQFPEPSHSEESLWFDKWVTGNYWERHRIAKAKRPSKPANIREKLNKLEMLGTGECGLPWQTVRDAIHDLPRLAMGQTCDKFANHFLNPGARSYAGHNGSPYDEPAKALKAGDHGVPGGENTLRFDDGSVRYFSVRECARIQTFPDDWVFQGSWTESMRQLGNAVPVKLGHAVAASLANCLASKSRPAVKRRRQIA